ncbi:MAG: sugar phosphate isomerase [Candidatus Nephthysia bennettiae]|nr:MAG: sugar phosphate isomerase [Candidatus Dormibacteraeota bacterium]
MRLSLVMTGGLRNLSPTELAATVAATGVQAIDAEVEFDDATIAAMQAQGLALGPMRIRASLADSDPGTRKQAVSAACRDIDRAKAWGLATVWMLPRNFRNDTSQRENWAAMRETMPEATRHAERQGVRIAIENCPFNGQNVVCTPEAWDALFALIPSGIVGICMDPSHNVWQGIDHLRATREYASRIYHVHAKDTEILAEGRYRYGVEGPHIESPKGRHGWWRHRLPGLGGVDWNAFITLLTDLGYAGDVSIEHEDPLWEGSAERVQQGIANARAHLARFIPA